MAGLQGTDARSVQLALGGYVVVFVLKITVYFATGLLVLLAEAFHTLGDVIIAGFLLLAIKVASRRSDEQHMFGYGRAQNVAGLVAATFFISFTAYKLYEESIPRLFRPSSEEYGNIWLGIGVIVLSAAVAAIPIVNLLRQPSRGAAAKAQLVALYQDLVGLGAALIGTVLIAVGWPIADPIASVVVATVIVVSAIGLFRENASFLLGRSPGPAYIADLERTAGSVPGVLGVHDVRAEYVGPDAVHAGLHVEVSEQMSLREANTIAEEVRRRLHDGADVGYCVIQMDAEPARPRIGGSAHATSLRLA